MTPLVSTKVKRQPLRGNSIYTICHMGSSKTLIRTITRCEALREFEPVKRNTDGSILLTKYADLQRVYKQATVFSSDKKVEFGSKFSKTLTYEHHTTSLVFNDPPVHTQTRNILQGALTPRAVAAMEPGICKLVDDLIDKLEESNQFDLVEDFAAAIPINVIGNLLRIPNDVRGPLRDWSLAILGALEPEISSDALEKSNVAVREFLEFLRILVADRRRNMLDPDVDILSRLIKGEPNGERLSDKELLHNCIFLLNAGHETTTNLIANALVSLSEWREEREKLIFAPGLIDTAINEFLRFESSNQLGNRRAVRESEIGGIEIPAGTLITLCIGAANRDPEKFENPDVLDISRKPNQHLAFGSGPHICLGNSLARLEGRIAIGRFIERLPNYDLAGVPQRSRRVRFRGYTRVDCRGRTSASD